MIVYIATTCTEVWKTREIEIYVIPAGNKEEAYGKLVTMLGEKNPNQAWKKTWKMHQEEILNDPVLVYDHMEELK